MKTDTKTGVKAETSTANSKVIRGAPALFKKKPTLPAKTADETGVATNKAIKNLLLTTSSGIVNPFMLEKT